MIRWCQQNNLKIANTFFKKRQGKLWTWVSPSQQYKNQIDFIIAPQIKNKRKDCNTETFDFYTDHRLLTCKLRIQKTRYIKKEQTCRINELILKNESEYADKINENVGKVSTFEEICAVIEDATTKVKNKNSETKESAGIPEEIIILIKKKEKG